MRAENLERISLCENKIGHDGCFALTKGNWRKISIIYLGNYFETKDIIILEIKDVIIL